MTEIPLISYSKLLAELKENNINHLLLGNGFNSSLGIKTSYLEIFSRMKNNYSEYDQMETFMKGAGYDIEKMIGHLKKQVKSTEEVFLEKYIQRKIKLDFMKATNEIVQENIKNVYSKNVQGIHLLLKNFTNYFTLNYDPFLYLLLLKFKKDIDSTTNSVVFQNTISFIEDDLNSSNQHIYSKIKEAKNNGKLTVTVSGKIISVDLNNVKKTQFISSVKTYFNDESWKKQDIDKVCNLIWNEEENEPKLEVQDSFSGEDFDPTKYQNLYFLHGAFHIKKNRRTIQKITAKRNKAFCEKLEEAVHSEDKEIICVLKNRSEDKMGDINANNYLKKCFEDLSGVTGALVILGSSLDKSDQHIFDQINQSNVTKIYISSSKEHKGRDINWAKQLFYNQKEITLFDYKTISYREGNNC